MSTKAKVAVICHGVTIQRVYMLAVAVAEGAWDAGAEVRVRRTGAVTAPEGSWSSPAWTDVVQEIAEIAEAHPDDLAWADVAMSIGEGGRVVASSDLLDVTDASVVIDPELGDATLAEAREHGRQVAEMVRTLKIAGRNTVSRTGTLAVPTAAPSPSR